jgi:PBSX family phage terminase large subunit
MPFSNKQIDFITTSKYDLNISSGSVRSGKTFSANIRFLHFLEYEAIDNVGCLITAKKGDSAERNVVLPFLEIVQGEGLLDEFRFTHNPRVLTYLPKNIKCYIEGGNDAGSEPRIRGLTTQAWLADEVTTYPKDFSMQCVARCSAGKRYKWWTTNPDSPSHYIKTDFIDKIENGKLNGKVWYWDLEKDNPGIDPVFIEQLKATYSGVFYERWIKGRWVIAEGVIYDKFNRNEHVVDSYPWQQVKEYVLGIDWGYGKDHPLCIGLFAVTDQAYYVIDEIYAEKQLINEQLVDIMHTKGWYNLNLKYTPPDQKYVTNNILTKPSYAYCDNARPDLMQQFYNFSGIPVISAIKDVEDGIQSVQRKFVKKGDGSYGLYFVRTKVPNHIREFELYRWDQLLSGLGKNIPKKENDHAPDEVRYTIHTRERGMSRQVKDFRMRQL